MLLYHAPCACGIRTPLKKKELSSDLEWLLIPVLNPKREPGEFELSMNSNVPNKRGGQIIVGKMSEK